MGRRGSDPLEFEIWLRGRLPHLRERWSSEIAARSSGRRSAVDRIVEAFVYQLVAFLPSLLGPLRDQIDPLWARCCELFGTIAAKRGLAAGEVIEEIQILRELIIRDLYGDPPGRGSEALSLREILRLNRVIDRGVTHASIGHTDAMFFQFFEAEDGSALMPVEELVAEAETQLELIGGDLKAIVVGGRAQAPDTVS